MHRMMEAITSKNNQWIKKASQLKSKKYRDKFNMFLLEGMRSVEDACIQEIAGCICLVAESLKEEEKILSLADRGARLKWRFFAVRDDLMRLVVGTEHSQGIILLAEKKESNEENLLKSPLGHYVLLDQIQDPGNMGTIIRTAAAAGVRGLLLTEGCCDIYSEKVVRSSMGSIFRIPIYTNIHIDFLKKFMKERNIPFYAAALQDAIPYRNVSVGEDAVFVFGNEGNGVSSDILALSTKNIYIPMKSSVESLNVSAAAAVILFHYLQD